MVRLVPAPLRPRRFRSVASGNMKPGEPQVSCPVCKTTLICDVSRTSTVNIFWPLCASCANPRPGLRRFYPSEPPTARDCNSGSCTEVYLRPYYTFNAAACELSPGRDLCGLQSDLAFVSLPYTPILCPLGASGSCAGFFPVWTSTRQKVL
jgi:hypothetical protein